MKIVADANIPFVKEAFNSVGKVTTVNGRKVTPDELRDADILLVRSVTPVGENLLQGSAVKYVGTATIGTDHIDLEYLRANGIGFASAPGCNAVSAAEYVVSSLLALTEKQQIRLPEKTVGIVGCGNVGSNVLARLQALGMRCLAYDPPRARLFDDREYATWGEVIQADIVTAHVPLTISGDYPTYHMFDLDFFQQLKTDAIFINTARGRAVDEAALMSVLTARPDLHLVLDVWQSEPDINIDLLKRTSIATSHIAGYSLDGKVRGTEMIYKAVCEYFGLQPSWTIPLLPFETSYTAIQFNNNQADDAVIRQSVFNAYNVMEDDARLRQITELAPAQRGEYFDSLRKNYRIRREFANYEVIISQTREQLLHALSGLGFHVETASHQITAT
jgi:erythronate-4-phosphate dehydrogenase